MRILLLLLTGLGAGVALGFPWRATAEPPRRERRVVLHEQVTIRTPSPEPVTQMVEPEPRTLVPAGDDPGPGIGFIEFDGRTGGEPVLFEESLAFSGRRSVRETTVEHVSPGRWRIRVTAAGCDPVEQEFEVGTEPMSLQIQLRRSTIR